MFKKLIAAASAAAIVFTGIVPVYADTVSVGTFTNTYTPDYAYVSLEFTKTLEGADLTDGQFEFGLYDENGNLVATTTNDADGNVVFDEIEYSVVGDYTYIVKEIGETNPDEEVVIDCDDMEAEVTVSVTWDEENDALVAEVTYPDDTEFNNAIVNPDAIYLAITATKTLTDESNTGRTLQADEFSFQIVDDETGEVVATGTNDENGLIEFSNIEYTEAGTHSYTMSEVAGDNTHISYSDATFSFTVTVTKSKNVLSAEVNTTDTTDEEVSN